MQREVRSLVWRFGALGLACALLGALLMVVSGAGWVKGMLTGLALAMSLLPEEFAVVLTVFLALGAWRIARSQVLTRSPPVIEALDAMTVLCVDKTGTLTANRMVLAALAPAAPPDESGAGDPSAELLRAAILASSVRPHDPMEQALHDALPRPPVPAAPLSLLHVYPMAPPLMAMAQVWQDGPRCLVACKGAPEAVARLCGLDPARSAEVLAEAARLAAQGIRVLAVASGSCAGPPWPDRLEALPLSWLGLVGLADPLRPGVSAAVAECHRAGIRVVMITGDHPGTALAIAAQAGLRGQRAVTGPNSTNWTGSRAWSA
jgi:Ca2+-transporting ATPase